jgi:hypothetical protein
VWRSIFLDHPLLKAGIVLVDLPGIQDANLERTKMTEEHIHTCQAVFIVANIGRVLSKLSIKQSLDKLTSGNMLAESNCPGKYISTAMICTKSHVSFSSIFFT